MADTRDMPTTTGTLSVTTFCGPTRLDGADRRRIQITVGGSFATLTRQQAADFAHELDEITRERR